MPSDSPDRQGRNAFANALPDYWIEDAILEGMAATAGVSVEAIKAELPAIRVAMRNAKIAKNTRKVLADWTPSKVQHRLQGVENQCRRILDGTDKNCRRLLKTLDVSPETAEDGITDAALSRALLMALRDDETEDDLRAAVSDLDLHRLLRWARTARQMLSGEQELPAGVRTALRGIAPGNSGEEWVDDFIRDLAPIYERLTGKPATAAWNTSGNKPVAFTAFVIAAERLLPDTAVGLRNPARAWQQRIERALPRRPAPENDLRD